MKIKNSAAILFLCTGTALAQTNTFPSSGNVGIGTTSPDAPLHIKTNGTFHPWIALDKNAGQYSGLQFRKSGSVQFYLYSDNTDSDALKIQSTSLPGEANATPRIQIPFNNKDLYLTTSGGNVAIGHKSPAYRLDVMGPANDWKARFQGPDGYITIGPTNPGWAHIYTDRPNFIFNQNIWSIPGGFSSYEQADLSLKTNGTTRLTISNATGNVGIGTTSPNEKLTVNGIIYGKEVKVDLAVPGPDYVFGKSYDLPTLEEVKAYVDEHKHLPEVPSADEMKKDGVKLAEMNMILLKKVEELTLYIMQQQEEIENLRKTVYEGKRAKDTKKN